MHSAFCIASAPTGREFDNLTGLHYYRARWYDASVGRFISEDPIGFAGGDVNLYGYVGNKPGNFVDPFGLDEYAFSDRLLNQQDPEGFRRRERMTFSETADEIQFQLAIYGLIPGIGEPFDLLDGGISLIRGDYCSASLSAASAIPFLGSGAGVIKIAKRADNAAGAVKYSDDLVAEAQKAYPKKAGKTERHHPFPKYLGGPDKQDLVPIDGAYHQQITNEFFKYFPKKKPGAKKEFPNEQRAKEIMEEVYKKYPLPNR